MATRDPKPAHPANDRIAAWRAVLLTQSRVVRAIESDLAAAEAIPLTTYDVLLELNAADGGTLRMAELGSRVVLSRTRVSRLVADLERQGYVTRTTDPDDGRATLARLTDRGQQALREAAPIYLAGIETHFSRHLEEGEQHMIASGLQRVIEAES